ncbi:MULTISPECIES: hypothetical protein [Acinetobacter]|uniref:Holin n=1 Tax=Acinetobacter baumannii TaxID=470 RepID=A0ABD5DAB9_ACIBA|nr:MULTISPECIES: hypothetical protein [Acinetobacter]EHU2760887.1 hypothetical protein [Acinetobacter baumannii]EHU3119836.1 hypothetical protein [Acinetobacter baumannii]EJB8489895.1 hypothetical protein [Acinetobacter baumannii]EKV7389855.1 hypothetical protein [Acinetobacter baumannii]EKW3202909.1 hypothetical protein [Acinetobacter baumannii]
MQLPESPSPPPNDLWTILATCLVVLITGFISVARRVVQEKENNWILIATEYSACLLVGYLAYEAYPSVHPHLPGYLSWITQNIFSATGSYIGIRAFHIAEYYTTEKFKPS